MNRIDHDSLEYKIIQNRRKKKWLKIIHRLRLNYFDYEDQGKGEKSMRLIEKISNKVLQPCNKCGRCFP
jgi:hypothetical protein